MDRWRCATVAHVARPAMMLLVLTSARGHAQEAARDRITAVRCDNAQRAVVPPPIQWQGGDVKWGEWPVRLGNGRGVLARLIVVAIDPRRVALSLAVAQREGELLPWNLAAAPSDARVALNAGQFTDDGPWGSVVHRGREWQAPGSGALAGAFVIDTSGAARVIRAREIDVLRGSSTVREGVQSYPSLLADGQPFPDLCDGTASIDRRHRDTRLAVGVRADGTVIVAMSRFDGGALPARTPIGPTTPEMAEIMRRLEARAALMLDGGLSAQLLLRDVARGTERTWPGLRNVPLALIGR